MGSHVASLKIHALASRNMLALMAFLVIAWLGHMNASDASATLKIDGQIYAMASEHCSPQSVASWQARYASGADSQAQVAAAHNGSYTYIQNDPRYSITAYGDNLITSFTVEMVRPAKIHMQLWRPTTNASDMNDESSSSNSRRYTLIKDLVFSATTSGVHRVEDVNWWLENEDVWGFAYSGSDEVPVRSQADSSARSIAEFSALTATDRQYTFNQDSPFIFNIQICSTKLQALTGQSGSAGSTTMRNGMTRTAATTNNYTCSRRASWNEAAENDAGPITYINGTKITSPLAILRDIELDMVTSGFIKIQVWRKDTANYEFTIVKEKTYYARQGYNMLPANLSMQYGDQWGFTYNTSGLGYILFTNSLSNSSYHFTTSVTGVGSKYSYAEEAPTTRDYKISPCIENLESFNNISGVNPLYGLQTMGQQYYYGAPNNNNMTNVSGASLSYYNGMSPQQQQQSYYQQWPMDGAYNNSATSYMGSSISAAGPSTYSACICADNSYWYSANSTDLGPYTFIDGSSFTEQVGNIQAFEIEAHIQGDITLQIWRPNPMNSGMLQLIWEKDVSLKQGYQRISTNQNIQYGDRWGFIHASSNEHPIKYYEDLSSKSNEFTYAVSNSIGQSIYLTSSRIAYKKYKIRPCTCITKQVTPTQSAISQQNLQSNSMNANYNYSNNYENSTSDMNANFTQTNLPNYGSNSPSQSNKCTGTLSNYGVYDVTGQYTYINFQKLPLGRLNTIEVWGKYNGMIIFNLWRYNTRGQFELIYEKSINIKTGLNKFAINTEVKEGDLYGFSYFGSGVVPIQYRHDNTTRAFETSMVFSLQLNNNVLNLPTQFTNKQFNIKLCLNVTSPVNDNEFSLYEENSSSGNEITSSQTIIDIIKEFLVQMNSGSITTPNNPNGTTTPSSGSEQCLSDGEATGPFTFEVTGPYTFIGDFGNMANKCLTSIQYTALSSNPLEIILIQPLSTGYTVIESVTSEPDANIAPGTTVTVPVNWCISATGSERIGFVYDRADTVPVPCTYYWGSAFELYDVPTVGQDGLMDVLSNLFETSKSFDMKVCTGESSASTSFFDPYQQQYGTPNYTVNGMYTNVAPQYNPYQAQSNMFNQQQQPINYFNSYSTNGTPMNSYQNMMPSTFQQQSNSGYNYDQGTNATFNANYSTTMPNHYNNYYNYNNNTDSTSGNAYYGAQASYGMYQRGVYYPPQTQNTSYTTSSPYYNTTNPQKLCVGSSNLVQDSSTASTSMMYNDTNGPFLYLHDEAIEVAGPIDKLLIHSSYFNQISVFLLRPTQQTNNTMMMTTTYELKYSTELNLNSGINTIKSLGWDLKVGDMVGFVSVQSSVNIPYIMDYNGDKIYSMMVCTSTNQTNPITSGIDTSIFNNGIVSSPNSGTCGCLDMSHWAYATNQKFGPFIYFNNTDLLDNTGYIEAFEISADFYGTITLHLWRRSSPYSDRITKIWSKTVDLTAGRQRVSGLNANFKSGDIWGFSFIGNGVSPIPYAYMPNQSTYEKVYYNEQSAVFISELQVANKVFKIDPCLCTYGNSFYEAPVAASSNMNYNDQYIGNSMTTSNQTSLNFGTDNSYQFCYGQTNDKGNQTKYGPFTYINFEPLPAGTIDYITFEATLPGELAWQLWRLNEEEEFRVVESLTTTFEAGLQTIEFRFDTEENDLIGFHFAGDGEIPIKFSKFVGAQSYEDYSPNPLEEGMTIPPPDRLVDQIFNYQVCMYTVTNPGPLVSTPNIGGYGDSVLWSSSGTNYDSQMSSYSSNSNPYNYNNTNNNSNYNNYYYNNNGYQYQNNAYSNPYNDQNYGSSYANYSGYYY